MQIEVWYSTQETRSTSYDLEALGCSSLAEWEAFSEDEKESRILEIIESDEDPSGWVIDNIELSED